MAGRPKSRARRKAKELLANITHTKHEYLDLVNLLYNRDRKNDVALAVATAEKQQAIIDREQQLIALSKRKAAYKIEDELFKLKEEISDAIESYKSTKQELDGPKDHLFAGNQLVKILDILNRSNLSLDNSKSDTELVEVTSVSFLSPSGDKINQNDPEDLTLDSTKEQLESTDRLIKAIKAKEKALKIINRERR